MNRPDMAAPRQPAGEPAIGVAAETGWSRSGRIVAAVIAVLIGSAISVRVFSNWGGGAAPAMPPLPVIAALPDFSLIERDDRRVQLADLKGFVWVANFVFTNCSGPCPTLSLRMRSLHETLGEDSRRDTVKLVSFTLDPSHDTPVVLRAYADRHHADPKRWWFLTGVDEKAMHGLVEKGFLQAVKAATADSQIIHSTYFAIVDRLGRIRAVHDGLEAASKPLILRDVDRLLAEPSS